MVFCYKIITETPRRSCSVSPSRSSVRQIGDVPNSVSQLIATLDYEEDAFLDDIPEREWRLLCALARKREEDRERDRLAEQFHRMWSQEKKERAMAEAETTTQYRSYIHKKRQQERCRQELRQQQCAAEQQLRRGQLMESIRWKERRSRDQLLTRNDKKAVQLLDKAIDEEVRAALAADRRCRQMTSEQMRRRAELYIAQSREREAGTRRTARLRDSAQRLAINNALSTWETTLLRQEIKAFDAAKRASHAAHAALTSERSDHIAREKDAKRERARRIAHHTRQLREDLKAAFDNSTNN